MDGEADPERVLFIFLDGFGIGEPDPGTNPLARAALPNLTSLFGALPFRAQAASGNALPWVPLDPTLGVPGRPQSGTGQTALLTGRNAARIFGRHFGPWVPAALRTLLAEENVLRRAHSAARSVAFANAYPRAYIDGKPRRPAAPPLAARSVGALVRDSEHLRRGLAVSSEIVNDRWRRHLDPAVPEVSPQQAGGNLARIAATAVLTLFAHYDTDLVGHRRDVHAAVRVLERLDAFLAGVLAELEPPVLLVVASDHGNIEDATTGHTLNPVPLLARGPGARRLLDGAANTTDVAPRLLDLLGVRDASTDSIGTTTR